MYRNLSLVTLECSSGRGWALLLVKVLRMSTQVIGYLPISELGGSLAFSHEKGTGFETDREGITFSGD